MMSRQSCYSEAPGGGDRVYLDSLGIVTGLTYSTAYSGGPQDAAMALLVPEEYQHRAVAPGRYVGIINGATTIWRGVLDEPTPGLPWQLTATGIGAYGAHTKAYAPTSNNALNLNEVVDQAIARGLPWIRSVSLPTQPGVNQPSGSLSVDDALGQVADYVGQFWTVNHIGQVSMQAAPGGPTMILYATTTPGGRSLTGFLTSLVVTYIHATSKVQKTLLVTNPTAITRFGLLEDTIDLTGLGPIAPSLAQSMGSTYLAKSSPRTTFSGSYTATAGQLVSLGGQPVDLGTVHAGERVRVLFTEPDPAGEIQPGQPVDLLVGSCSYDSDTDTLTLGPVQASQSLLARMIRHETETQHRKLEAAAAKARHAAALAAREARQDAKERRILMHPPRRRPTRHPHTGARP